jgi:hypothetical protein
MQPPEQIGDRGGGYSLNHYAAQLTNCRKEQISKPMEKLAELMNQLQKTTKLLV